MLAQGRGRWAVSQKRIIYRLLHGGGGGGVWVGGGEVCSQPPPYKRLYNFATLTNHFKTWQSY